MSAPFVISNEKARALILARTALSGARPAGPVSQTLPALIAKLGYVQLDPIRVVERAHHHILFARNSAYRPKQLERLRTKDTLFFEQWTHDSSLIPIAFYPYWRHRFADQRKRIVRWMARFGDKRVMETVRAHIRAHGAARARDFAHLGGRTGPWWGWGPAKGALEYLWRSGELAVVNRNGFEKIYDLPGRVIPQALLQARPSRGETLDWACCEALARLGAATPKMLADFWDHASVAEVTAWIAAEKRRGQLVDAVLTGAPGRRNFAGVARPDIEEEIARLPAPPARMRALAPFDPVLRDRDRAERLFDFSYRIEVYVPGHKRKHGYYVFPLLEGGRFVGRIDMKAEREHDRLTVRGVWLEGRLSLSKPRRARLEQELARQARLAGVRDIVFPQSAVRTV